MGDTANGTSRMKSWFQSLKSEFNKIIWPNKEQLTKETTVVVTVSVILGILIAILDMVLQYGIQLIIK
jgi:preprotein translocase subunit SecE